VRGGAKNRLRPDDVKVQKLIEAFKEKSGYTMTSEEIRKKQEEQDAKVCRPLCFVPLPLSATFHLV
jgi:hypothetical protein